MANKCIFSKSFSIVFFFLSIASFLAFIVYFLIGTIIRVIKKKPADWWKLGFIGLMGLLGFIPQFGPRFYGLYGFFALFGLKNK